MERTFEAWQVKLILYVIADLVEESIHIPIITKKITSQCRDLAKQIQPFEMFKMQEKTGGDCLFSAKNWEIVKIIPEENKTDEKPEK